MAKKKDYDRYTIEEIIDTISESEKANWGKFLLRASMDDKPSTIDIRHIGIDKNNKYIIGKGISLNNKEADKLTNSLVTNGYGDTDVIEEAIKKRKSVYYDEPQKE
jgi:hypothetical protein